MNFEYIFWNTYFFISDYLSHNTNFIIFYLFLSLLLRQINSLIYFNNSKLIFIINEKNFII